MADPDRRWWMPFSGYGDEGESLNHQQQILAKPELKVVTQQDFAKWIRWGVPTDIIIKMDRQRQRVLERRRIETFVSVPDFAYPMPQLPLVAEKSEVFATAIDTDGLIQPRVPWTRIIRYRERIYRYRQIVPRISFSSTTYTLTEKFANMLNVFVTPRRQPPPRVVSYICRAMVARAVRATYLAEPHLIKWKSRAQEVLKTYTKTPFIP